MAKILYVEDDETLGFVTMDNLMQEGYEILHCKDGMVAKKAFKEEQFDLCIVDVMMPKMDGFQLATYIREVNSQIPIIFVTAKSLQEDKIKGLQIGADDYITKPFSIEELVLKINVFLKRKFINDHSTDPNLQVGKFTLDMKNLRLVKEGLPQKITQREGELLEVLASHKNEIVKRKLLLERIWGKEDYFLGRSMDVFISRLRKHLSGDPKVVIENVHGVGFRLTDQ
ncbi:MAG: DNA-binding response OmpR family regulator [Saprospiraceae bacterium]|jgi:DNA-binding response OmpR family regulator